MYLVVFVSKSQVTYWSEHQTFFDAQFCAEEVPYHTPELGTGHIITECAEHGWRPVDPLTGACQDCHDLYCEFEFRQEVDYYEFEMGKDNPICSEFSPGGGW